MKALILDNAIDHEVYTPVAHWRLTTPPLFDYISDLPVT